MLECWGEAGTVDGLSMLIVRNANVSQRHPKTYPFVNFYLRASAFIRGSLFFER